MGKSRNYSRGRKGEQLEEEGQVVFKNRVHLNALSLGSVEQLETKQTEYGSFEYTPALCVRPSCSTRVPSLARFIS